MNFYIIFVAVCEINSFYLSLIWRSGEILMFNNFRYLHLFTPINSSMAILIFGQAILSVIFHWKSGNKMKFQIFTDKLDSLILYRNNIIFIPVAEYQHHSFPIYSSSHQYDNIMDSDLLFHLFLSRIFFHNISFICENYKIFK